MCTNDRTSQNENCIELNGTEGVLNSNRYRSTNQTTPGVIRRGQVGMMESGKKYIINKELKNMI